MLTCVSHRHVLRAFAAAALAIGALTSRSAAADAPSTDAGVVSHISVVSDKVPDVSSLDAWKQSFIKPGMTEKEKAIAVWKSMVMFRHQANPPGDFCSNEGHTLDPIRTFNVYGYNMCDGASGGVIQLARAAGLEARGWGITAHSVPEIKIDGKWALFDTSLINYFEKPDGTIAGVEEIAKACDDWLQKHPDLRGNNKGLVDFQKRNGWTGWREGPELLTQCKFYDAGGFWPAHTHGWSGTMQEYSNVKKNFLYEYGAALGYQVNLQLRKGERITRNWSNHGLHVDMLEGKSQAVLTEVVGKDQLKYSTNFGDLAPGRIGNGTHEYDVPLADGSFSRGMLLVENLTNHRIDRHDVATLRVENAARPGVLIVRMPSSYVYVGGKLDLEARIDNFGAIVISFSDNNGLDWKPVANLTAAGNEAMVKQTIDLKPFVFRHYDYRIKLELSGANTGLNALKLTNDIQHSQRPLPALDQGKNTISFRSGPQEGTITIEGSLKAEYKGKSLYYTDFHPATKNIAADFVRPTGGDGELIFPIDTPGDITRIRVGAHYRARGVKDNWDLAASFDGGKTFKPIGKLEGPYPGFSKTLALADVPAGSRSALVKVAGTQKNTLVLFDLRIDADYQEPAGAFAPVKVIYNWDENGQSKQDVHIAKSADESYTIECAGKPGMKSIVIER